MKKLLFTLSALLLINSYVFSQTPQNFNYQAVVRDNLGAVLENQAISLRIEILQTSASGTSIYSEEHSATTNQFGLVNLFIGGGTPISGDFTTINWGADIYFLQIELDPSGGTSYQLMGVSQLLTVPYAMHSNIAENVVNDMVDDADADPNNELQSLSISNDSIYLSNGNSIYLNTLSDTSYWEKTGNNLYYNQGNVGIGAVTPNGRLLVQSDTNAGINDDIFSVLNANGDTVFAVYQEGVRIWIDDNGGTKANGSRGGFAVGGFSPTKAGFTNEYLRVTPDSVRIYIDETYSAPVSGSRGGFAVGGFNPTKGTNTDSYLFVQDDSTRVYVGDSTAGFGIASIQGGGNSNFLNLTTENYFIGHESGLNTTPNSPLPGNGLYNSFIGYNAGKSNVSGFSNNFIGYLAGRNNVDGYSNMFIGENCGRSNTSGYRDIFIGNFAGYDNLTGANNIFIGNDAGHNNTSGGEKNFIVNSEGLYNQTAEYNVCIGFQAGLMNTGNYNTMVGSDCGSRTTSPLNCFYGHMAAYWNITGSENAIFGTYAGVLCDNSFNTMFGSRAGLNSVGSGNVFIGYSAGHDEMGSNKLYIANSATPSPLIYGDFVEQKVTVNDVLNIAPRASAPLTPVEGDLYMDSTTHILMVFDGTIWRACW